MRYKNEIRLVLRCYDQKVYTFDETVDNLLSAYSRSKYFNYSNFMLGFTIGSVVTLITYTILK